MLKIIIYVLVVPLVVWALDSVNINTIFKKNKEYQARMLYMILIFSLSYLFTSFLCDFCSVINF